MRGRIHIIMTQLFFRAINTGPPYNSKAESGSLPCLAIRSCRDYPGSSQDISSFTYSVWKASKSIIFVSDWQPYKGFQANSLAELMEKLPGARTATGIRISMKGPGFFISQSCYGEDDYDRLMDQSAEQIDRCLARGIDEKFTNYGLHTDFILLEGEKPRSPWIFGQKY